MRSLAFCSWWLTIAKPPTQKPEGEATAPSPTPETHRCRPAVTSRQQPAPCAPFWIFLLAQLRRRVFRWWVGEPRGLAASCCHHAHRMPCASWGELVGRHGSTVVGSHRFPRRSRPAQAWSLLSFSATCCLSQRWSWREACPSCTPSRGAVLLGHPECLRPQP